MVLRSIPAVLVLTAGFAAALVAGAEEAEAPPGYEPAASAPQLPVAPLGPESRTEQLLAPIALYPDPLLAVLLPASTAPADLTAAATYLVRYGDTSRIDGERWDPSVRALAHYPAVLSWMAQNLEWTEALGQAFLASPEKVMAAIQSLRARALAAGTLRDTPQERIVIDGSVIQILPVQADAIYAPSYDSDVVYSEAPYYDTSTPFMNFGDALPVGGWLSYCFDWADPALYVGAWGAWHGEGGWRAPQPGRGHRIPGDKRWIPAKRTPGDPVPHSHRMASLPLPLPLASVPPRPPTHGHPTRSQAVETSSGAALVPSPNPAAPSPAWSVPAPGNGAPAGPSKAAAPHGASSEETPRASSPGQGSGSTTASAPRSAAPEAAREWSSPPSSSSSHASAPAPAPSAPAPAASSSSGESRNH
jgi:hypothetical protein